MANEKSITTPSGQGGLQRFDEDLGSKIQIKPELVAIAVIVIVVGMAILKHFRPI